MNHAHTIAVTPAGRQHAIAQLLRTGPVSSQVDLLRRLRERGIGVTQGTLSRDLRRMGVVKTPAGYRLPEIPLGDRAAPSDTSPFGAAVGANVVGAAAAGTLVILRTLPGHAQPAALELDVAPPAGVVGTVAGDDTVFVATTGEEAALRLAAAFRASAGVPELESGGGSAEAVA